MGSEVVRDLALSRNRYAQQYGAGVPFVELDRGYGRAAGPGPSSGISIDGILVGVRPALDGLGDAVLLAFDLVLQTNYGVAQVDAAVFDEQAPCVAASEIWARVAFPGRGANSIPIAAPTPMPIKNSPIPVFSISRRIVKLLFPSEIRPFVRLAFRHRVGFRRLPG